MSKVRDNTNAPATNAFKLPREMQPLATDQGTAGTDTGTFTGIALAATMTKITINGVTQDITAIPLADGTGLAINPEFEGLAQAAIADALNANAAQEYIENDNITVALTIVDATPDTFTVAITQRGRGTVTSVYIGGATKTLSRA